MDVLNKLSVKGFAEQTAVVLVGGPRREKLRNCDRDHAASTLESGEQLLRCRQRDSASPLRSQAICKS